jgi:hypothetical protein
MSTLTFHADEQSAFVGAACIAEPSRDFEVQWARAPQHHPPLLAQP